MKIKISCVTICFCMVFSWICVGCSKTGMHVNQIMADRYALTACKEDLQQASDLVVVVTPKKQENILSYYSDGLIAFGYTKTTADVVSVLQGEVAEESEIIITEECYLDEANDTIWTQGAYLPMENGNSYLLFLKAYEPDDPDYGGMYYPVDLEYGKYLLSADTGISTWFVRKKEKLEIAETADIDKYIQWREYVIGLYPDAFE